MIWRSEKLDWTDKEETRAREDWTHCAYLKAEAEENRKLGDYLEWIRTSFPETSEIRQGTYLSGHYTEHFAYIYFKSVDELMIARLRCPS